AGAGGERERARFGAAGGHEVTGNHAAVGGGEPVLVGAWHHLEAAGLGGRVVERGPDLEEGRAVEAPEGAAVLVPGKLGAARGALHEERGAVEGDRPLDEGAGDAREERVRDPFEEERV